MAPLLDRIKKRARDTAKSRKVAVLPPPATAAEIAKTEDRLGFPLPHLLMEIYTQVANGGFGPGEGFIGVSSTRMAAEADLVKQYKNCLRRDGLGWPVPLLPAVYCGCDVFFCIDCGDIKNRVIMFDGDLGGLDESDMSEPRSQWPYPDHPKPLCFRTRATSFANFLEMWLTDETQLFRWT